MTPVNDDRPDRVTVFFYGLFMDVDALRLMGFHPESVRQAGVNGMELRIGQRAALAPAPSKSVHGFLMEFSQQELDRLYADSGVAEYRPEAVLARLESGAEISAVCYNLPVQPSPGEENPKYATKLRELGHRLGLPGEYLQSIGWQK